MNGKDAQALVSRARKLDNGGGAITLTLDYHSPAKRNRTRQEAREIALASGFEPTEWMTGEGLTGDCFWLTGTEKCGAMNVVVNVFFNREDDDADGS